MSIAISTAEHYEREFEIAHASLVRRDRPKPIERVAALLLGLVSVDRNEDRDLHFIVDSIPYDVIANSMMSVDTLTDVLIVFELGLIEPHMPAGLRLKDIGALEVIADGRRAMDASATQDHYPSV